MNGATEHLVPGDDRPLALDEFARIASVPPHDVAELVDYGLIARSGLDMRTALALREAARLRADFDLDLFTTGLLAGYLRRIDDLEGEVQRLRARAPARAVYTEVSFTSVEIRR
ncbi:MAG TPA: hypothetical protein VIE63_00700 [Ramlibacter sp.]